MYFLGICFILYIIVQYNISICFIADGYVVFTVLTSVMNIKDDNVELAQHEKAIESIKRCLKLIENVSRRISCRKDESN